MSTLTEISAELRGALKKVARSRGNNMIRLNFVLVYYVEKKSFLSVSLKVFSLYYLKVDS